MEMYHLKAEERRWCSNLLHSDLLLVCKDGKVSAHSARLVDLSVYLLNLLEQSRGCSNCKEPVVIQLPDFTLHECEALMELIYKGGTTLKKTKVERVVALSRTLGIKLANVFGDVPPKDAATSPSSLRFPIHGFQGDERQLKATHQSAIFKMAPKSAVVTSSQKIAVIRPATAVKSSQKPTVIVASSPQKVATAVRSAVMSSSQQLNRSAINMANIPVIKISATTPIKPAANTRVIKVATSFASPQVATSVASAILQQRVTRKRQAGNSEDKNGGHSGKSAKLDSSKKENVIKEELDVKESNDKTVEVTKVSARGQKRGKTMPTRQLSTSTRRAKQAPVTQSKSPVKSEPEEPKAKSSRPQTGVTVSERSHEKRNLIAEIASSEVEDKILAEIEEKINSPSPVKPSVPSPVKECKSEEKKEAKLQKCWFCDRACRELAVHVALHHFKEQILKKTENGQCMECKCVASENELILHIAFEHMGFNTKKKSFTPQFLQSKGLVVEISEKEIPKLVKSTSSPQLKEKVEKSKENPAQAAKEQKTKPAVKEIFIVKKPDPQSGLVTRNTKQANTVAIAPKPEITKPQPAKTRATSLPELRDKKSTKTEVKKSATKSADVRKQQQQQKKKMAGAGCGTCVKCKLPDCETCVFCQNKQAPGGGKGFLMKVCVKKVCRNRN